MARRSRERALDADEIAELPVRRQARLAREARAREQDRAHDETMAEYGKRFEQLFRSKRRQSPNGGNAI